jgi:four helix bundle protein
MSVQGYNDLKVFQKSYASAMEIYELSKSFPPKEKYSLADQIRRCSRSVSVNIGEAYRKRIYPKHFVSELSDSDGEGTETMIFLDFAKDCGYISKLEHKKLIENYTEIGKMLGGMMQYPEKFSPKKKTDGSDLPTASAD